VPRVCEIAQRNASACVLVAAGGAAGNLEETIVKTKMLGLSAALAALMLSACAVGVHGDRVAVAGGVDYYDGYYDGYYGPFNDGYWGDDGYFWYQDGGHAWHRDDAHHFQRTGASGFNHIHGSGMHREH
jgi:hypothetical protein